MTFSSAVVLLFFVMDPLGNIPLFITALREVPPERRRKVVIRELLIALAVLMAFLFLGQFLLDALHVSSAALTASGGIVLLLIAIRMIFPSEGTLQEQTIREPFVFPLAVPYTAGPSAMAMELLLMSREPERWLTWAAAVFVAWFASAAILLLGSRVERLIGERGLLAIERLMGMILVMLAVEMLLNGWMEFFGRPGAAG